MLEVFRHEVIKFVASNCSKITFLLNLCIWIKDISWSNYEIKVLNVAFRILDYVQGQFKQNKSLTVCLCVFFRHREDNDCG